MALAVTVILVIAVKAVHRPGDAAAGRASFRTRGRRLRRLDGRDAHARGTAHSFLVSSVTFIMALLVAQTRVETGVHSSSEVASGALLGALVTLLLFQAFG